MISVRRAATAAFAFVLACAGSGVHAQLNDTGQQSCTDAGGLPVDCDSGSVPGQDGAHGRDALASAGALQKTGAGDAGFDFGALDAEGNPVPAGGHACVRDHVMGLVWSVQTQDARDWASAQASATTAGTHCGLAGWRLPTRNELLSLLHHGSVQPAIDTTFFPGTLAAPYWSAERSDDTAWTVDFAQGDTAPAAIGSSHAVRLVATDRNQPPRITLGEDIVIDNRAQPQPIVLEGWARDIAPGPASEAGQRLTATLELLPVEDQKALQFRQPPELDLESGTLSFTVEHQLWPFDDRFDYDDSFQQWTSSAGLARVRLTLRDDGGTRFGGVDTTVKEFTIFLDPRPTIRDTSVRNSWFSPCVPVSMFGWDADSIPTWEEAPHVRIESAPAFGYLSEFGRAAEAGVEPVRRGNIYLAPPYYPRLTGGYALALCYIPFRSNFTGFDTFTFRFVDRDGNESELGVVSIEIEEN